MQQLGNGCLLGTRWQSTAVNFRIGEAEGGCLMLSIGWEYLVHSSVMSGREMGTDLDQLVNCVELAE